MRYRKEDFDIGDMVIFESFQSSEPMKQGIITNYKLDEFNKNVSIFIVKNKGKEIYIFYYRIQKIIKKEVFPEMFV